MRNLPEPLMAMGQNSVTNVLQVTLLKRFMRPLV